jgi:2-oxoglutarate dehydrogenase E1 component
VEQIFPFPADEIRAAMARYRRLGELVWVQEEPENMGAWEFARPALEELSGPLALSVFARPPSSSPAEGSAARHQQTQHQLVTLAFDLHEGPRDGDKPARGAGRTRGRRVKAGVS